MKFAATLTALAASVSLVAGQTSLCDKYTTALLKNNTAENQLTVITLVVNTALIGNYTNPAGPAKNAVTGILANGTYMGTPVSLLKYFDGSLASTNQNGMAAAVNWLDGGGPTPLMNNTAANDTSSNQYTLITHLYGIFGGLLGCSKQNASSKVFPAYQGSPSMSDVHRFMNIDAAEEGYFIQEVGLAATSFGVSTADATTVGNALTGLFSKRCAPPAALPGSTMKYSQSICVASDCPLAANSNCTSSTMNYGNGTNGMDPQVASSTSGSGSSGSGSSGSGSSGGSDGASSIIINAVGVLALGAAGLVAIGL